MFTVMPERFTTPIVVSLPSAAGLDVDLTIESTSRVVDHDVVAAICNMVGLRRLTTPVGPPAGSLQPGARLTLGENNTAVGDPAPERFVGDGFMELAVTGGATSGTRCALVPGRFMVGRSVDADVPLFDPTVSTSHATVDLHADGVCLIADNGSVNGTFVNEDEVQGARPFAAGDVVRTGTTEFEIRPVPDDDRPVGLSTIGATPFNRPPRHFDRASQPQITPPKPPPPAIGRAPFRVTAIVVPLLFAVVMVMLTKQIIFAAFAAMSPVMLVANTISDRRSNRDRARRENARFRMELAAFDHELAAAAELVHADRTLLLPDLAETLRRSTLPSRRLWERRPDHPDFMNVRLGRGDFRWIPPLSADLPLGCEDLQAILKKYVYVANTAIGVDLGHGAVVGIAGPRTTSLDLARSLLAQVTCHHGPADVRVIVAADADQLASWDWLKWLPHIDRESGIPYVALGVDEINFVAKHLQVTPDLRSTTGGAADPHTLVVLDVDPATLARLPALRSWLTQRDRPCSIMVLSPTVDALPSSCTTVVSLSVEGAPLATVTQPTTGSTVSGVLTNGLAHELAVQMARQLCRFSDPETKAPGASLPRSVALSSLLGLSAGADETELAGELIRRWSSNSCGVAPAAPIGMTEAGPLVIDLGRDGPHGLIGGTTGAGKSELLRAIVVSFALQASPEELTFVLIDYKGGSAFDECAKLPHVVGMVTDLDESLSARAVVCLEAELRYREQLLRAAGASDRDSYARIGSPMGPLPRLAIVVDEFAALKNELPEFIDALVDVAQRGRSLGVHLLLATQRPAGVVSDLIRANTELKIGLRMQEPSDSTDVIGTPSAAFLPRSRQGMALARFGAEVPVAFQAAYTGLAASQDAQPVRVSRFRLRSEDQVEEAASESITETELHALVRAAVLAHINSGRKTPRRPWPEPLPEVLAFADLRGRRAATDVSSTELAPNRESTPGPDIVNPVVGNPVVVNPVVVNPVVGIVDDPARQAQGELRWDLDRGNLFLVGARRSETSSALASLAVALAHENTPETVHMFAVKSQASSIDMLTDLPHLGDTISVSERPRLLRLVRELSAELGRRSASEPGTVADLPRVIVFIDNLGSVKLELDDPGLAVSPWDQLLRVLAEGPQVGIVSAITFDRPSLVSGPIAAVAEQRWVFQLTDRLDYSLFGLRGTDVGPLAPLRCVDAQTGLVAQICAVSEADVHVSWAPALVGRRAAKVRVLPTFVEAGDMDEAARLAERPWAIPVGVNDTSLSAAFVEAHVGEHLLVTGPSRSGRSTILAALAQTLRGHAHTIVLASPRSPLARLVDVHETLRPEQVIDLPELLANRSGPVVVLIDDAELIDDQNGVLANLIIGDHGDVMVVAAVRPELLRTNYSHWTRQLRRSRLAVLLRPNDIDAEFAGIAIPRRGLPTEQGRGFLAQNGQLELVQFCVATSTPMAGAA